MQISANRRVFLNKTGTALRTTPSKSGTTLILNGYLYTDIYSSGQNIIGMCASILVQVWPVQLTDVREASAANP